ncbi:cupin [Candidatus Gottesmanbacteria bacterium RIFCSPLOWO2_12_FULL_42_10]|nr:MAG: cupin [Candidatus Gottesmanbacteria bacterium RIFCSPLOWO2_12_FULL_42_10]
MNDLITPSLISDLVKYQEGSVVSREVIKKPGGTFTLFAFYQGQGLSEHRTPYDALVILLAGEAEITVSGKANLVKEGQILMMPANHPHSLKAVKKFKMGLMMIK